MLCKICNVNETDKPDRIYDDCKLSIINNDASKDTQYKPKGSRNDLLDKRKIVLKKCWRCNFKFTYPKNIYKE